MAGKNPRGGGGNTWSPYFLERQGDYGMHKTVKGKIVYARPRHQWSSTDLMRIMRKYTEEENKKPPELQENFTWWQKAINFLAEWMLDKIISYTSLNEEIPRIIWSWIQTIYLSFWLRLGANDSSIQTALQAYNSRLANAVERYTQYGDHKFLDALVDDLYK